MKKKNYETATHLQAFFRGCLTRMWYRAFKRVRIQAITYVQACMRRTWARRKYLRILAIRYSKASILIQRFTKGYLVSKVWAEKLHRAIIDRLTAHFRVVRHTLHTDSQIKIRFAWRIHKQRKRIKAEKKKAAAAAKAKKKGKFGRARAPAPSTSQTMPAAAANSLTTANYQAKNDKKEETKQASGAASHETPSTPAVKQNAEGIMDLQITQGDE